jgi:hypothetical protein
VTVESGAGLTSVIISVGMACLGAIIWLIRLEGRVNTNEALHTVLKEQHGQLADDVRYIRERIDDALNGRHR